LAARNAHANSGIAFFSGVAYPQRPPGKAMSKRDKTAECSADPRTNWKWVAMALCVGVALWLAIKPQANSPHDTPKAQRQLTPAEQERALRNQQLQAAEKLIAAFPESDDAVYLLGLVHNEQGDTAAAMKFWRRSLEMDATRADANDNIGHALLLRDEYAQAEEYFRKALAIDPTLATANFRLATALVHQAKMQEAIAVLERAQSLSADGHRLLGEAYRQLENYASAKAHYEKALQLKPDLAEAHYGLSKVCARLGDEKSREHFEKFFTLNREADEQKRRVRENFDTMAITRKSVAQTHTDVGRVYARQGRTGEAEELWLKAAALDPKNTVCRLQLAILYQQTNKDREALRFYEEIAMIDPSDALVHLNVGRLCVKLNDPARAERAFKEVIKLAVDRPEGHAGLAELYLQGRRNMPEAFVLAETAVKLAPEASYYALLGQACAMNRDRAGALAAFNRAVELRPDNPQYAQLRDALLK
jgi:tetratricopeptide (TPR) repeat protein